MSIDEDALLAPMLRLKSLLEEDEWFEGAVITEEERNISNVVLAAIKKMKFCAAITLGSAQAEAPEAETLALVQDYIISLFRDPVVESEGKILPRAIPRVLAAVQGKSAEEDGDSSLPDAGFELVAFTPEKPPEGTLLEIYHLTFRVTINLF
jgi:hypothetical protein